MKNSSNKKDAYIFYNCTSKVTKLNVSFIQAFPADEQRGVCSEGDHCNEQGCGNSRDEAGRAARCTVTAERCYSANMQLAT